MPEHPGPPGDSRDAPGDAGPLAGLFLAAGAGAAASPAPGSDPPPPESFPGSLTLPGLDRPLRVIDLEQPRFEGMPVIAGHFPGYLYFLHRRHGDDYDPDLSGPRSSASGVMLCMEHSGTHIDAISHQADGQRLLGGFDAAGACNKKGFRVHGVETIPPLVGPAVLLDVAAARGVTDLDAGALVTAADLDAACRRARVEVRPGDVVLVRTGNGRHWTDSERYLAGPGLGADASAWLAGRGVVAVGADNMAWDLIGLRDPALNCDLPGHLLLLARRGIYILENLRLEELAAAGAGRFTFLCTPLKFTGATGSPVRPVAILGGG